MTSAIFQEQEEAEGHANAQGVSFCPWRRTDRAPTGRRRWDATAGGSSVATARQHGAALTTERSIDALEVRHAELSVRRAGTRSPSAVHRLPPQCLPARGIWRS